MSEFIDFGCAQWEIPHIYLFLNKLALDSHSNERTLLNIKCQINEGISSWTPFSDFLNGNREKNKIEIF